MKNLKIAFWCLLLTSYLIQDGVAQSVDDLKSESLVPLWSGDLSKNAGLGSKGDLATINGTGNGGCPSDYFVQGLTLKSSRNIMGFGLYPKDGTSCDDGCTFVSALGDVYDTDYLRGFTNSAKFLSSAAFTHLADECCVPDEGSSASNGCTNFDAISGVGIGGRFIQEVNECKSNGFLGYYHFTNTGEFTQPVYEPIQVDPVTGDAYLSGSWLWHWIIDDVERQVGLDDVNSNNNTVEVVDIVQGDNGFIYAAGYVADNCSSVSGEEYDATGPFRPFIVKIKNIFTGHPESTHLYNMSPGESFKVNSLAVHDGQVYLVGAYSNNYSVGNTAHTAAIMRIDQVDVDDIASSHVWELYAPISDHESEATRIDFATGTSGGNPYSNIILIGNIREDVDTDPNDNVDQNNWDPFLAVFPQSLQTTVLPAINRVDAQKLELYKQTDIYYFDDFGRALLVKEGTTGANGLEHDILLSGNHQGPDVLPYKYHLTYRPFPGIGQNTLERTAGHDMRFYKGQGRNHDIFEKYISTGDYSAEGLGWIRHDETGAGFWSTDPTGGRDNCCQSYFEPGIFDISSGEIYMASYSLGYSKLYFYEFGQDIPFERRMEECKTDANCTASEFVDCQQAGSVPNAGEGALQVEGLESSIEANVLSVYPNPNEGYITLNVDLSESQKLKVNLYDLRGRKLETLEQRQFSKGQHALTYHLGSYSDGTYVLRVEGDQWASTEQITIQKK